jgi:hypothetical protein
MTLAWYFAPNDRRLRYGDGRYVRAGVTHRVEGPPVLCEHGLHVSIRPIDALQYAHGSVACIVWIGGEIVTGYDKIAGTERTYLRTMRVDAVLRAYARWCALQAVHLWDCPDVVREWLETGREDLRDDALAAAWSSARDAARSAAWSASRAAARGDTAGFAAWDAARSAAWSAAQSAGSAAWDAAEDAQNAQLDRMLRQAMGVTDELWAEWEVAA